MWLADRTGFRVKRTITISLAGALAVIGFWVGEGGLAPGAALRVAAAGVIGGLAVALTAPGRPWLKAFSGITSLAFYAVSVFAGASSFERAYSECVKSGEEIRVQLREYRQENNRYPDRLSELAGLKLCGRISRPTILEYARTNGGYVLSFRDWLVEHTATESEPFMAHK